MTGIYLLLGSNLGDRDQLLSQARELIQVRVGSVVKSSSLYNTTPWGSLEAGDFLNQVVKVDTHLNYYALLYRIISIEIAMGRQFQTHMQSRYLDIDILYYKNKVLESDLLTLPHPRIAQRRFVLVPMVEIAPHETHPNTGFSQIQMLEQCSDTSTVHKTKSKLL